MEKVVRYSCWIHFCYVMSRRLATHVFASTPRSLLFRFLIVLCLGGFDDAGMGAWWVYTDMGLVVVWC